MENINCEYCEGTGIATLANGPDDVETTYCSCPEGNIRMQNDDIRAMIAGLGKKMRYV